MKRKILSITLSLALVLGSLLLSGDLGKSFAEIDDDWNYCSGYLDDTFPVFPYVDFSPFDNASGKIDDPYVISTASQLAALSVLSNNFERKRSESEIYYIRKREKKRIKEELKQMEIDRADRKDMDLKDMEKRFISSEGDKYDYSYLCDKYENVRMGDNFRNCYFIVDEDIDLSAYRWTPIGSTTMFEGNIDFQGHTVNGIRIIVKDRKNTDKLLGLFATSRGSISNLIIGKKGYVHCDTDKVYFGNVVAFNLGKVINCENNLSIKTVKGKSLAIAGGIVGYNAFSGVVKDCHNKGELSAASHGDEIVGGVVGESSKAAFYNIIWCTNEGNYFFGDYGDAEGTDMPDKISYRSGIIGYVA